MKHTKILAAAMGVLALGAIPSAANASVYFLVGSRHVYRIGTSPYIAVTERQGIEQTYADEVNDAQARYDERIKAGDDPQVVGDELNLALDAAANRRDESLASLYQPDDAVRVSHPELVIDGDGPYQVIGVQTAGPVWSNFVVYRPWPSYVVVDAPYGWVYGRPYSPFAFHQAYSVWFSTWSGHGGAYVGLYGHHGFVNVGISLNIRLYGHNNGFAHYMGGPGFHMPPRETVFVRHPFHPVYGGHGDPIRDRHDAIRDRHDLIRDHHDVIRDRHDAIRDRHDVIRDRHDAIREHRDPIREHHDSVRHETMHAVEHKTEEKKGDHHR